MSAMRTVESLYKAYADSAVKDFYPSRINQFTRSGNLPPANTRRQYGTCKSLKFLNKRVFVCKRHSMTQNTLGASQTETFQPWKGFVVTISIYSARSDQYKDA